MFPLHQLKSLLEALNSVLWRELSRLLVERFRLAAEPVLEQLGSIALVVDLFRP